MKKMTFGQAFFIYTIYLVSISLLIKYGVEYAFETKINLLGVMLLTLAFQLTVGPILGRSPKK